MLVIYKSSSSAEVFLSQCHHLEMYALRSRRLLRLSGRDVDTFIQGVVTNDIGTIALEHNKPQTMAKAMYTAFLNPKGRYLFDGFVIRNDTDEDEPPSCYLDVHQNHLEYAVKYLNRYKLRSKVVIEDVNDTLQIGWTFSANPYEIAKLQKDAGDSQLLANPDPRWPWLGMRSIEASDPSKPSGDERYNSHRLALGVPETPDFEFEKSLPLESSLHWLNGVCFHKGCYVGQELTARTHFTGTVRKRLTPFRASSVQLNSCVETSLPLPYLQGPCENLSLEPGAGLVNADGESAGRVTSFDPASGLGMAMIRSESLMGYPHLNCGETFIHPWIPMYWSLSLD